MKKIIFITAIYIPTILLLTSCGGPKNDAKKVCDCFTELEKKIAPEKEKLSKEIDELQKQGSTEASLKALELSTKLLKISLDTDNECTKMMDEFTKKYKGDNEKYMEFAGAFDNCGKESKN